MTGEWRRLQHEEFYNLYPSPNIIWVMKSRKTRCTGQVAHIWRERCIQGLVGKPEEMRLRVLALVNAVMKPWLPQESRELLDHQRTY